MHSVYGVWLGWAMAAIYMGGRIPQIVLNVSVTFPIGDLCICLGRLIRFLTVSLFFSNQIKRGSVEVAFAFDSVI